MGAPAGGKGGGSQMGGMGGGAMSAAGGGKGGAAQQPAGGGMGQLWGNQPGTETPNQNNNWGGNQNYYGGFQGAGNVFDQSAAGLGGAMNAAFQGLNFGLPGGPGGSMASWGGGGGGMGGGAKINTGHIDNYNPTQIQGGAYGSQSLANTDLGQYMNPYTSNVIDQSMEDMNRARAMEQMQTGAKMGSAGAFGGSRHGLAEAENNRNFYDRAGAMAGNLRQQGFQNAQQAAMSDIANQNQASQFNIGQDMQSQMANQASEWAKVNAQNQNAQQQANLSNQMAMNRNNNASQGFATRMNAMNNANSQRLQAANMLANFSNMGFGMGNTANQNMWNAGNQQQNQQQQIIDAAKQQWGGYTGAGGVGQGYLNNAIGGAHTPQGQTNSSSPGLFDWIGTGLGAYGTYAGLAASDKRLKTDIVRIGQYKGKQDTYPQYRWKWNDLAKDLGLDNMPTVGVMAQEVEYVNPKAVHEMDNGYKAVDYGAL